jgi:hypothetical protein
MIEANDMAGDWIKFELATMDKPEVCQIADAAGIDPDAAVGKLLRVWGWFDQQTECGNAPSVSKKLLDRLVGVSGFCDFMQSVGWMVDGDGIISLPNFDRHNGKTAKNRVLTAKRVANHKVKSNDETNAPIVSGALPKEEKRREENKALRAFIDEVFSKFWKLYPKKVSKKDAIKAWIKIDPELFPKILEALTLHRASEGWVKDEGRFIPNAATWLNAERWEDEVKPYVAGTHAGTDRASRPSLVDQVRQRGVELQAERDGAARREAAPAAELWPAGMEAPGIDWDGEFSRIDDTDGSLMGADD